ncbi:hypothetical protein FSP39_015434 [Pinctada imbricata]|uniref:Mab-21-like nucleotidyltransferase domain-containing protein n=1 Tax=Pinctada imbricata TaxID=66713 RepID=A0AA88Y508_PINIB|nr:hypothetical protein FSP39_015434 [Pinctada imbricata]
MEGEFKAVEENNISEIESMIFRGFDVNKQDDRGNSILHKAVERDSHLEVLMTLLANGADVNLENKDGKTPVALAIKNGSDEMVRKLFELEQLIHYDDSDRNCLLHVLFRDRLVTKSLMEALKEIGVDVCVENKYRCTPLHTAAGGYHKAVNQLTHFLDTFHMPDFLVQNTDGNTFLHLFFKCSRMEKKDIDFMRSLVRGEFKNVPKGLMARLLNSRNNLGNTPFHLLSYMPFDPSEIFEDERDFYGLEIMRMCLTAGADINMTNNLSETPVHLFVQNTLDYDWSKYFDKALLFFQENGLDLNSKNINGFPPIFQCPNPESVALLLEMKVDLDSRDNFGRTLLMTVFNYDVAPDRTTVEQVIQKCSNINASDKNGNTALHYAIWREVSSDVIRTFKENGAQNKADDAGNLPCHIAEQLQNEELFKIVCECGEDVHSCRPSFLYPEDKIDYTELMQENVDKLQAVRNRMNLTSSDALGQLLHIPGEGIASFNDGEGKLIKQNVECLVRDICHKISERERAFSNCVIQSGSVSENTKIEPPNEFDFVCLLEEFGHLCEVDDNINRTGFVNLRLKHGIRESMASDVNRKNLMWFFDSKGRLDVKGVRFKFTKLLNEVLHEESTWKYQNMCYSPWTEDRMKTEATEPVCQFSVDWIGCRFKFLHIKIDLAPACKINDWIPENIDHYKFSGNGHSENYMFLFQSDESPTDRFVANLRVSSLLAERRLMQSLTETERFGYICAKILSTSAVCPEVAVQSKTLEEDEYIGSYILKNCLFHVMHEDETNGIHNSRSDIREVVIRIFRMLIVFAEQCYLPVYFLPFIDAFSFAKGTSLRGGNRRDCMNRIILAKVILFILGDSQEFTPLQDMKEQLRHTRSHEDDASDSFSTLSSHSDSDLTMSDSESIN